MILFSYQILHAVAIAVTTVGRVLLINFSQNVHAKMDLLVTIVQVRL